MREPALPNFFIVGAGKAGTTSLYHYLGQHPQIYMSRVKEPSYFASEVRTENLSPAFLRHIERQSRRLRLRELLDDGKPLRPSGWLVSDWEDYLRLFQDVQDETAIGEATVSYLWSRTAAANIAARLPDAKIIMLLRDPAERAFSQHLHQMGTGLMSCTLREHIEVALRYPHEKLSAYHPFLEVGLYHDQVKRYLDRFPRKNIRIYWYEEDWREPVRLLMDMFEFLGVDPAFRPDTSRKSWERRKPRFPVLNDFITRFDITYGVRDIMPSSLRERVLQLLFRRGPELKMEARDRQFLIDYYREDIMKLAALLNRDLSAWLSVRV
jgi:hypothetical protein